MAEGGIGFGRAVEDAAYARGFRVVMCNTDEDPDKESLYLALMRDENIAGVIVSPAPYETPRPANWGLGLPLVMIDRQPPIDGLDSVVLDNVAAAATLTTHLIQQGYRRIAGLFGGSGTTGEERRAGFLGALRDHGLEPVAAELSTDPPFPGYGYTIGFEETFGFPEVVIVGLKPVATDLGEAL